MQVANEAMKSSVVAVQPGSLTGYGATWPCAVPIAMAACFRRISPEAHLCARVILSLPEEPRSNGEIEGSPGAYARLG
jgi:hypothetical protein